MAAASSEEVDRRMPERLYRRWWMAGPWTTPAARRQHAKLSERAADGHAADEPLLRALWAKLPEALEPGPWTARCRLARHRGGPSPSRECTCGIHGTEKLRAALAHGTLDPWQCAGIFEPKGRMFETGPGVWRVERARLVSLVDVSADPGRKVSDWQDKLRTMQGTSDPRLIGMCATLTSPEHWAARQSDQRQVLAAVALRYGVPVADAGEECS